MKDSDLVVAGQELVVPRADGILHKVGFDETLNAIVDLYDNITVETAMNFRSNRISDPTEELEVGSYVLLPGAVPKPPPPPPEPEPEPTPAPQPDPAPAAPGDGGGSGAPPSTGGRFANPLSGYNYVTDEFGTSRGFRGGRMHTGIDLGTWGAYSRSTIYSSCNGTVARTEYLTYSYGYHVVVNCGDGWTTLYAHMSRIDVSVGQSVAQGTPLGATGLTGFTTGEHLHFEIRRNNAPINPRELHPLLAPAKPRHEGLRCAYRPQHDAPARARGHLEEARNGTRRQGRPGYRREQGYRRTHRTSPWRSGSSRRRRRPQRRGHGPAPSRYDPHRRGGHRGCGRTRHPRPHGYARYR
ncbi:MAG: M23 family metallopeptidase [Dehalococcoidia bacterium]|nr:M23 family metallopeptidase [Dehalococcoidia bacterium]